MVDPDRAELIRGNHGSKVEPVQSEKKRGILSEKRWLGGWFGSIQTEPNPSVDFMVEKLDQCNLGKKLGRRPKNSKWNTAQKIQMEDGQ